MVGGKGGRIMIIINYKEGENGSAFDWCTLNSNRPTSDYESHLH